MCKVPKFSILVIYLSLVVLTSCEDGTSDIVCVVVDQQELVGADSNPEFLSIGELQRASIGVITSEPSSYDGFCTATLVTPNWGITAAHCDIGGEMTFYLRPGTALSVGVRVKERVVHPTSDLLLFELETIPSEVEYGYIPVIPDDTGQKLEGDIAGLAGYGDTLYGPSETLLFAVEQIVSVTDDRFIVDGNGVSGACGGDSGSPLLTRSVDGEIRIAGVLTVGSASCVGTDEYIRMDRVNAWIDEFIDTRSDFDETSCNGISTEGKCFGDVAVWCGEETSVSSICVYPERCGWDASELGYRCVTVDPCSDISSLGNCLENYAVFCHQGALVYSDCGECGGECRRSSISGQCGCYRGE